VPDHPLAAGLEAAHLRDWRGAATLVPPRLDYEISPRLAHVPVVRWCGLEVSRVWRSGNRGSVASVLIEKPARGDFLPILEGGYSLQYSPLLEHREGKGLVLFCQMDVTGRSEADPVADGLTCDLLEYIAKPSSPPAFAPSHRVLLAGGGAVAKAHLEAAGLEVDEYSGGAIDATRILALGSGAGLKLAASAPDVARFLDAGGRLLALGLSEAEANAVLPFDVTMKDEEHIAAHFEPEGAGSPFAGIGPADVHNRDPRRLPLVAGGAAAIGNGILARAERAGVVFCQLVPYEVSKAAGALPSLSVDAADAADGKQSALLVLGSVSARGGRLGQKVAAGERGRQHSFAIFARGVGGPVTARLEIERAGRPSERVIEGREVVVPETEWIELHEDFEAKERFGEGWFAGVRCAQEGARLRLDGFRLHEGSHVPQAMPAGARNLFSNPGFEEGAQGWSFLSHEQYNVRRTYRRASFLVTRLLANLGAAGETPLLERFARPADAAEKRWLSGFYLDEPEEWDDPYRFFRW
jgi:hypothetical protein